MLPELARKLLSLSLSLSLYKRIDKIRIVKPVTPLDPSNPASYIAIASTGSFMGSIEETVGQNGG
jgi:hypothetical protein